MHSDSKPNRFARIVRSLASHAAVSVATVFAVLWFHRSPKPTTPRAPLAPRRPMDTSSYGLLSKAANRWQPTDSLQEIARYWDRIGYRAIEQIDARLKNPAMLNDAMQLQLLGNKAEHFMFEGEPDKAYATLELARSLVEGNEQMRRDFLSSVLFFQGVAALRRGENDNCIMCRGESSCILPISAAAVHKKTDGSRLAIKHFTEYLQSFPDDLEVQWLLNVAHMTLGEYPQKVDPRYLVRLDHFLKSEVDIGRFCDIGESVGVN